MKFIVVSAVVTDEIHFLDGNKIIVPGGAGIYALAGIKLWEDDVEILTGIGEDYVHLHGEWYKENQISMNMMKVKDEHSPYTIIQYFKDGEREEIPRYGLKHFNKLETSAEELRDYLETSDGIYIFKNCDSKFWESLLKVQRRSHTKIMWEIAADGAIPSNIEKIEKILKWVDAFSINITEARSLFQIEDLEVIINRLQKWNLELVFLRLGAKGAVLISREEVVYVPSQPNVNVVDPTGGGNSSTGGVLCGMVNKYSLKECGIMGCLSAAMCISQHGVPQYITKQMRTRAKQKLKETEICEVKK